MLSWHWIFLVNLPIGVAVYVACLQLVPVSQVQAPRGRLDLGGAVSVTVALMLAIYAIVNGNEAGWQSPQTLGLLGTALLCFIVFLLIESKAEAPLVPLSMFRRRNLSTASAVGMLWSAAMFAWFFISALYMQLILSYQPLQVGLAFLPANVIMAAFSLGLSAKIVMRFGITRPLVVGLLLATAGLVLFAQAPANSDFLTQILPSMLLLGVGAGMGFNPLLLAAMNDVDASDSGLASGVVNTAFMMGGALGLAILASVAGAETKHALAIALEGNAALVKGYHLAFFVAALFALVAAVLGTVLIRAKASDGGAAAMSGGHA